MSSENDTGDRMKVKVADFSSVYLCDSEKKTAKGRKVCYSKKKS